ncbi:LytR C-terminal domain-containing protein [Streptomyces sp. NPDC097619]|uniref:LCP family protein n=1 Tax=Streptomyces sp. NPDC097619 TaxID=3157228 RepID=UPI003322267E
MNDRQDPYDGYQAYPGEQQLIGYDAYGRPIYGPAQGQQAPQYDQYEQQQQPAAYGESDHYPQYGQQQYAQEPTGPGYGYDAYGAAAPPQDPSGYPPQAGYPAYPDPQQYAQDPTGPGYGYDPDATGAHPAGGYAQQAQQGRQTGLAEAHPEEPEATAGQWIPQQSPPPGGADAEDRGDGPGGPGAQVPEPRRSDATGTPDYRTEQFAFLDQPDGDSEDVIDWLKFTESRTERREEARRRGRNRVVALIVVLALFVISGVGYLWATDRIPGLGGGADGAQGTTAGPQKRDMIVVHLHDTKKGGTSTALLVDNVTTKRGATVLLPNALAVNADDGTPTTLGKSVEEDGLGGTRESLDAMLGTRIEGTWRLDTPYLENLVELVGGIEVDTDTAVPAVAKAKTPAVAKGEKQSLSGAMAVAYATFQAPGEPETRRLQRFGTVLYGVLRKLPDDPQAATVTVETLAQILDPSLTEKDLGSALARLAEHAKIGDHTTRVLTVKDDGSLPEEGGTAVVKELLGGAAKAPEPGAIPRVGLRNATGSEQSGTSARVALVNGGYTFVDGGKAAESSASQVTYADPTQKTRAEEVAKTLGLPAGAVKKAESPVNADVVVVLGTDYKAP